MRSTNETSSGPKTEKRPLRDHLFFFVVSTAAAVAGAVWAIALAIRVEPLRDRLDDAREKLVVAQTELDAVRAEHRKLEMTLSEQDKLTEEQRTRITTLAKEYEDCRRPPAPKWVPKGERQENVVVGNCNGEYKADIICTPAMRGRQILETPPNKSTNQPKAEYKDLTKSSAQGYEVQLDADGVTAHVIGAVGCGEDTWDVMPVKVYACE
jgi:hypothetical protein